MKFTKMMMALVFACMMFGATCQTRPTPVPIEPDGTHDCVSACRQLQHLGCIEGNDLEDGTTCKKFCIDTQQSGHPLNPTCVMGMKSCSDLPDCTNPR